MVSRATPTLAELGLSKNLFPIVIAVTVTIQCIPHAGKEGQAMHP